MSAANSSKNLSNPAGEIISRIRAGFGLGFTPREDGEDGYAFEAPTRFDRLFVGVAVAVPAHVERLRGDRAGTEHITAADTFEGDYATLLARPERRLLNGKSSGKGVASPTGFEPVF